MQTITADNGRFGRSYLDAGSPSAAVAGLLTEVRTATEGRSGAFVSRREGMILVEEGQVCWATHPDLRPGLGERLRRGGLPGARLREVVGHCRREGQRWSHVLTELRRLGPIQYDCAMREHAAEAVVLLASEPLDYHPKPDGYRATHGFTGAELLATVGAIQWPALAERARETLAGVLDGKARGAAFFTEGSDLWPLAARGQLATVPELMGMCEGARLLGEMSSTAVRAEGPLSVVTRSDGQLAVTWREDEITFAAVLDPRSRGLARALSHRRSVPPLAS